MGQLRGDWAGPRADAPAKDAAPAAHLPSPAPPRLRLTTLPRTVPPLMLPGQITLLEAHGCEPAALRAPASAQALFEELVRRLDLRPVAPAAWHRFPEPGGYTGFLLLSESHLSIHTFPEHGYAAVDLYCCKARSAPDWRGLLARHLGAREVAVRLVDRGVRAAAEQTL